MLFMPLFAFSESFLKASTFPSKFDDLSFKSRQDFLDDEYEAFYDLSPYHQLFIVEMDKEVALEEEEEEKKEEEKSKTDKTTKTKEDETAYNNLKPISEIKPIIYTDQPTDGKYSYCSLRNPEIQPGQKYPFGKPVYSLDFRTTSKYGPRKIGGNDDYHYGYDIGGGEKYYDRPVFATADGVVNYIKPNKNGYAHGNYINIRHDNGFMTKYMHLNRVLVTKGQPISAGCIIGTIGNTGGAKALSETLKEQQYPMMSKSISHLHYEIHYSGKYSSVSENGKTAIINHGKSKSAVDPEPFLNAK
jgi:murein DD-endopeptidase MepM/ murein hydrolase activator NlpD